jgi:hypothetical protein
MLILMTSPGVYVENAALSNVMSDFHSLAHKEPCFVMLRESISIGGRNCWRFTLLKVLNASHTGISQALDPPSFDVEEDRPKKPGFPFDGMSLYQ